jgi:hypothetical protein
MKLDIDFVRSQFPAFLSHRYKAKRSLKTRVDHTHAVRSLID